MAPPPRMRRAKILSLSAFLLIAIHSGLSWHGRLRVSLHAELAKNSGDEPAEEEGKRSLSTSRIGRIERQIHHYMNRTANFRCSLRIAMLRSFF